MTHFCKMTAALCTLTLSLAIATVPCAATEQLEINQRPVLKNPVTFNTRGTVSLNDEMLMDLIIPDTINGVTVEAIGSSAFQYCALIRTVTIPATVTSIGAHAFASCPYLEIIILEDRFDMSDLQIGANWAGNAQVYFDSEREDQAQLESFHRMLEDVQAIKTVDKSNLDDATVALRSLDDAYAALSEENQAHTGTIYQKTRHALLSLIQQAEATEREISGPMKPEEELPDIPEEAPPSDPATDILPDSVQENITEDAHQILP